MIQPMEVRMNSLQDGSLDHNVWIFFRKGRECKHWQEVASQMCLFPSKALMKRKK